MKYHLGGYEMHIYFISIAGNTRAFISKLEKYSQELHDSDPENPTITSTEVYDDSPLEKITIPFFVFVPTYLEGGNGIDNGDQEILTESMRELLAEEDNYTHCLGVIGSGNKNFNNQYCLTAKQYAEQFQIPFLADYELRGTESDVKRIYGILKERIKK